MPEASTKQMSLTQAAGHAFAPQHLRDELIALQEDGGPINSGFKAETPNEKREKEEEEEKQRSYVHAVASSSNIALSIGNFIFSSDEVSNALSDWVDFQQDQLEMAKLIDQANQSIYLRHEDGTLYTQSEINAYQDQNSVCVANPYDLAADIASTQSGLDAAAQAKALLDSGQQVDLNTLPKGVADQLVTQRIEQQIANGETVDLSEIPPEFKDTAINAVIGAEMDAANQAAYTKAGLTEEQWKQGGLLYDENARAIYDSEMSSWEQSRRAELSAEAGVDYKPPAPSADTTTAPSSTTTAPGQDTGTAFNLNDPNTWMPPTAG